MKIKSIQFTGEQLPTYDIEVPDVHQYNCEGLVSHNSSLIINATNGIEPPREYLSIKRRLKQIVPQYNTLKNKYTLLWDMKSNRGYMNIVAVMQKFFDQAISSNWSYNPEHYEDKKIPMSRIIEDWLYAYRMGHKTAYYQNTYDGKKEEINLDELLNELETMEEESCEACT